MQGWIRAIWRFWGFVFITSALLLLFLWLTIIGQSKKVAGLRIRRSWIRRISPMMGFEVEKVGDPPKQTCLIVANHISYVDPVAILTHADAYVVAKAEVKRWPLVGWGANVVGTIFVKREEKTSRHETAKAIQEALEQGMSILVFPEGTTTAGPQTLPFRPRSFGAAHQANVPVQPVAIFYDRPEVAFIGKDTFIPHFFRLFRLKKITGRIAFGPLLYGEDTAQQAEQWINTAQSDYLHHLSPNGHPEEE